MCFGSQVIFLLRILLFGSMFLFNGLMWTLFVKSMQNASSSAQAMVTNSASNFLFSVSFIFVTRGGSKSSRDGGKMRALETWCPKKICSRWHFFMQINILCNIHKYTVHHSRSRYGLETWWKSSFYLFVHIYANLSMVKTMYFWYTVMKQSLNSSVWI